MFNKADLHIHTNCSDGKLSPREIITLAKNRGIDLISITDHDTTAGILEGMEYGNQCDIDVVPGIELSTLYKDENIHILGYFKNEDYRNVSFQKELKEIVSHRINRAKTIINNLDRIFNIRLDYDEIYKTTKGVVGRPHIAKAIIEAGYPYEWEYIFHNFLNTESPAYVSNKKINLSDGIKFLKSFGALVVLAHPIQIKASSLEEMMDFNFDGIEAIYPQNSPEDTKRYLEIARTYNKFITAGSDFHGISGSDKTHGVLGDVYLEREDIEKFLSFLS